MTKSFFCVKRGDHLSLGSLPGKGSLLALADSPRFSSPQAKSVLMNVNPVYKDVPYLEEKIKKLKILIDCERSAVALWTKEMPRYELLPKVREQLSRNEKLLEEITGAPPCQ